jgi:iron complex outermembrane recepter protein
MPVRAGVRRRLAWSLSVACVLGSATVVSAQTPPTEAASGLKRLSVDDLVNLEVTSVSRRSERLFEAPASVYVISADDIRRSGATTLPEVLRLAPNLDVARVDPVQHSISARGFNNAVGNKLLVLIDGRTIYTPLFSGVFWDQQDLLLEDIERIEVISGPGATLWGANAVNGIINVITKPTSETQGGVVSAALGSDDRGIAMRWGGTMNAASYRAYAKLSGWDHTDNAAGTAMLNDWQRHQVGMRVDWSSSRDTITTQGDAYTGESEHRGFAGPFEITPIEVAGLNVLTKWTRRLDGDASMHVQAYFDHAERDDFVLFRPKVNLFDLEFQHSTPVGAHRLLWGGGYRHSRDHIDAAFASRFFPDRKNLNWENVFVHTELRMTDRIGATIGTKLENNDYTGLEHLPSARVTWKALENHFLWGGFSRAVRAPSRFDREVFFPMTPPFIVVGGPNFVSEVANVFEAGYRGQPAEAVSYSVTAFTHLWDRLRSGTAVPVQLENRIEGPVYGVEAWATYRPAAFWTLSTGTKLLSEHLELEPGSTDPVGVDNPTLRNDPDYQWMFRSSMDLSKNVELDVNLRGVAALPKPAIPAYTEMDIRVAWRPNGRLALSVNGRDLLHDSHPEFGDPGGRGEIPRRVSCEVRWSF